MRSADSARPQEPGRTAEDEEVADDVFVYRDTAAEPDASATAAREPDKGDASYWYDLSGDDSAQLEQEARGPFEPLVSRGPFEPLVSSGDPAPAGGDHRTEQIKDFFLTAEAIGDRNVDKHFDQLLAQQRELIGEYFRPSGTGTPDGGRTGQGEAQAGAEPAAAPGREGPGHQEDPPRGASLIAEPPRVW